MFNSSWKPSACKGGTRAHMCYPFSGLRWGEVCDVIGLFIAVLLSDLMMKKKLIF